MRSSLHSKTRSLDRLKEIANLLRKIVLPAPKPRHLVVGRMGERLAANYLRNNSHKILYRNFRAPHGGEIDLVCRDKRYHELVFVEVKTRSSEDFGRPLAAVDRKKRRLILRGAIEVIISGPIEVRHIENAFQLPDNYSY
jgi:Holliday junction resolvase-like predicted endonuclease